MAKPGKHKVVPGANKKVVSLQHEIIRQSGGLITKDEPQKKKEKKKGKKKVNPLARPRDAESFQREIARQYGGGLIHSGAEQQKPAKVQGQLPGESYKQFTRRLAEDSRKAILEETRKNRKSSARRKKFLDTKKERERTKKHTKRNPERDFAGPEQLRFGEVAERPPEFSSASDNTSAPAGARLALNFPALAKATNSAEAMRLTAVARYRELKKAGRMVIPTRKDNLIDGTIATREELPGAYL